MGRVCLDILRTRVSRREEPLVAHGAEPLVSRDDEGDPEHEALMADSVGLALLVVLETLAPAERLAFVLHDIFGRALRRDRTDCGALPRSDAQAGEPGTPADPWRSRQLRQPISPSNGQWSRPSSPPHAEGNFEALLAVLDPDVVLRADDTAVSLGGVKEIRGVLGVAKQFLGRAQAARPALVRGTVGVIVAPNGRFCLVLNLEMSQGKIVAIEAIADPDHLDQLNLVVLNS